MFDWISDHRASIALVIIIALAVAFVFSIFVGVKQTRLRAKDEVFFDNFRVFRVLAPRLCAFFAI